MIGQIYYAFSMRESDLFIMTYYTDDDGKKEETAPQKEGEDVTDYGKAVAQLKSGEKKQRVPKV